MSSNRQATLSVLKNAQGQVTSVNIVRGGALNSTAGTAIFNSDTGEAALTGISVDGNLLLMQGVNTQTLRQTALNESWPTRTRT